MARIRLRYCTVRFIDGHSNTGKVNDGAISAGNTSLDVDSIVGALPAGCRFSIAGVKRIYTLISSVGGTSPSSITFTPALATADILPTNGAAITFYGRCLEVKVGDGNLTWDTARNLEYEMDRGEIDAVVEGDDIPVDVSLDLTYEYLTAVSGAGTPTPEDVLKQRGEAADWVTAGTDPCEVYAVTVEVDYEPPCNYEHEISTFPEFRWETVSHDISQATLSVQGKCKATDITTIRRAY